MHQDEDTFVIGIFIDMDAISLRIDGMMSGIMQEGHEFKSCCLAVFLDDGGCPDLVLGRDVKIRVQENQDTAHEEQYLGHPLQAVRIILELIVDNTGQDEEE